MFDSAVIHLRARIPNVALLPPSRQDTVVALWTCGTLASYLQRLPDSVPGSWIIV